jgi:hypothetical protein
VGKLDRSLSPQRHRGLCRSDFFARHGFLLAENESGAGGGIMAKVIEFYVPSNYHKIAKWIPAERRGQVIEFSLPKKTA